MPSVKITPELEEMLEDSRRRFVEKFGREPGPDDPVLWDERADTPMQLDPDEVRSLMISAFKEAGTPGHLIYAFDKTGLCLTEETLREAEPDIRDDWNRAISEWGAMSRQQRRKYLREVT